MSARRANKILIVEEESLLGWSMANALRKAGYEPDVVECGDEAIRKMTTGQYELVISDYRLPGMDGLNLAGRVKKLKESLPIIMITTHEELDDAELESTGVVNCIIEKPFKLSEIVTLVGEVIEGGNPNQIRSNGADI